MAQIEAAQQQAGVMGGNGGAQPAEEPTES
jgi:hypothetical protein